jgi:hypothetical protein
MLLYNKFFSDDTPASNRKAWMVMMGIYGLLAAAGLYFLVYSIFLIDQINWRILVQALILIFLGGGGFRISLKGKA